MSTDNRNHEKSEKWYNKKSFTTIMLLLFFPVGLYFMWKNKHFKKWVRVIISLFFGLVIIGTSLSDLDNDNTKNNSERKAKEKLSVETQKIETDITADLNVDIKDGKINVEITTNAIDGSIFEFFIIDNNMEIVTDLISVENGIAKTSLKVNENWEPGYLATSASMRFNIEDHPQPNHVQEAYGKNGEKLEGELIRENNLDGYNIAIDVEPIAYPDIETAKNASKEKLDNAINEMINVSKGIIKSIQPSDLKNEDWRIVRVVVSDNWYYSEDYEKERFAEQIGEMVKKMVLSSGIVPDDKVISVYFYDSYNKELASPKTFGGYKIKR